MFWMNASDIENFFGHGSRAAASGAQSDALALKLRQIAQRFICRMKEPENLMGECAPVTVRSGAAACFDATLHEGDLNSRMWVVQKPEVFERAVGRAHIDLQMGPRKYVLVAEAQRFVVTAFKRPGDCDLCWRSGNGIPARAK